MMSETVTAKADHFNSIPVGVNGHIPLPPTPSSFSCAADHQKAVDDCAIRPTNSDPVTNAVADKEFAAVTFNSAGEATNATALSAGEEAPIPLPKPHRSKPSRRRRKAPSALHLHRVLTRPAPPANDAAGYAWCCDCGVDHPTPSCPQSGPARFVADNPPPSMAFATCPPVLRIGVAVGEPAKAVFAKRTIPARSWFGPFRAEMAETESSDAVYPTDPGPGVPRFLLPVSVVDQDGRRAVRWLVRTNEVTCSWMMFVRPAENVEKQNCVAMQFQGAVYFATVRAIQRGEEMKVWYAPSYARAWGMALLAPPPGCEESRETTVATTAPSIAPLPTLTASPSCQHQPPQTSIAATAVTTAATVATAATATATVRRSSRLRVRSVRLPRPGTPDERRRMQSMVSAARRMLRCAVKRQARKKALLIRPIYDEMFCFDCRLTFSDESIFQVHKMQHRGFPPDNQVAGCVCAVCRLKLPHLVAYAEHVERHAVRPFVFRETPGMAPLDRCEGEYACGQCCQRSLTYRDLCLHKQRRHLLRSAGRRSVLDREPERMPITDEERGIQPEFVCQVCKEIFRSAPALATHVKKHSSDTFYSCHVCQESMPSKTHFILHGEKHRQNGVFPCPFCVGEHSQNASKRLGAYRSFNLLNRHIRTVHSARVHPCPYCERSFRLRQKLVQHLSCHIDTPGFVCERCGQRFKRKDKYTRHLRNRHGAWQGGRNLRRVQCPQCPQMFAYRAALDRHLRQHAAAADSEPSRLQCPLCYKKYVRDCAFRRHFEKAHPTAALPPSDLGAIMLPGPEPPNEDAGSASLSELLMAPSHTFLQTEPPPDPLFEPMMDCGLQPPPPHSQYVVMLPPPAPDGHMDAAAPHDAIQWREVDSEADAGGFGTSFIISLVADADAGMQGPGPNSPSFLEELGQLPPPPPPQNGSLLAEVLPHGFANELLSPGEGQGLHEHPPGSWML